MCVLFNLIVAMILLMRIYVLAAVLTTFILYTSVAVLAKPYSDHEQLPLCAHGCSCTENIANCSGIGYQIIPPLPAGITTLLFSHNQLHHVSKDTFKNVINLKISHLDISFCDILQIDADALVDLLYLMTLDVSGNHVPDVIDVLRAIQNTAINTLRLKFTGLSKLPSVNPLLNITNLDISGNDFSEINATDFATTFPHLNTLIADHNRIRTISFQSFLDTISVLSVRDNEITDLDLSCKIPGNYSLDMFDVSANFLSNLTQFQQNGHCFPKLKTLILDHLPLRDIPDRAFSNLTSLIKLSMDFIGRLQYISPLAFHSKSLEVILVGTAKSFQLGNDSVNLFQNTRRLTNLTTIQLKFPRGDTEFLGNFIAPLKHLRNLTLKFADISYLPERFLKHTSKLVSLTLVGNFFSNWNNNVFPTSNSLRYIDFGFNHITDIDKDSFPAHVWDNVLMLDLSNNPFVCSCPLYWFRKEWIPDNIKKLRSYPSHYYCESPQAMKSRLVSDYFPSAAECLDPLVVMAIVLSVCLFVIVTVGALGYKYRWHLKYYVFLCRTKSGYKRINEEEDHFHFDAFVAYNSDDRDWVLTKLMPFLEKQQKFRLCLHDRDFDPGKLISDNIVENMRKSRKLILVLSNSFTSSEWCQFELLMAQGRFLKEGSKTVILVMLEKVTLDQMSGTLGVLLQNNNAIEWTNDRMGRNLFWDELLSSIN
nr:Toll-like receptor protein [Mimachlamys nobilis]